MKSIWKFLGLSFAHYIAEISTLAYAFALGQKRFDTLEPPSIFENILHYLSTFLMYPLGHALSGMEIFNGLDFPLSHLPFIINSLVWGALLYSGLEYWKTRSEHSKKSAAA